jgi:hypothetical protein
MDGIPSRNESSFSFMMTQSLRGKGKELDVEGIVDER